MLALEDAPKSAFLIAIPAAYLRFLQQYHQHFLPVKHFLMYIYLCLHLHLYRDNKPHLRLYVHHKMGYIQVLLSF